MRRTSHTCTRTSIHTLSPSRSLWTSSKLVQVDEGAASLLLEPLSRVATRLDVVTASLPAASCESERVLVETVHPYPTPVIQTWDLEFPGKPEGF
jgi:hypothetical protein